MWCTELIISMRLSHIVSAGAFWPRMITESFMDRNISLVCRLGVASSAPD